MDRFEEVAQALAVELCSAHVTGGCVCDAALEEIAGALRAAEWRGATAAIAAASAECRAQAVSGGPGNAWCLDCSEAIDDLDLDEILARPIVCPCQTSIAIPGPHVASCPWSDPDYDDGTGAGP